MTPAYGKETWVGKLYKEMKLKAVKCNTTKEKSMKMFKGLDAVKFGGNDVDDFLSGLRWLAATGSVDIDNVAEMLARQLYGGAINEMSGETIISHMKRVAKGVRSPAARAVAWLHEVVEDGLVGADDLAYLGFPTDVIMAVIALSRPKGYPYPDYIQMMMTGADMTSNDLIVPVKISDLKDNLRVSRLKVMDDRAVYRLRKYHKALGKLTEFAVRRAAYLDGRHRAEGIRLPGGVIMVGPGDRNHIPDGAA
jgi:hypothetical protein